ncbi:MAG: FAD-binding oxidoreductase, partial [Bacteroidota bacterium]
MLKSYILPVHRVVQETADAISLHFKQPAVDRIWYKAGQYLSFRFHLKGESHVRSYSISSAPRLDDTLAVTIKKVEGGLISNYLLADAHPGMQLEMSRPLGRFFVENSVKEERQLVLLGAGSGITPLFSILRSTLINEPKSTVALIYANRSPKETIFRDQLQSLQQTFASRFQLINHYSQEQGRMEVSQFKSYLEEIGMGSEAEYMLCGPEGWMKMIRQGLYEAGIPEHQLRQESFAIPEQEQKAQLPSDGPTREVEVQLGE